MTQIQKAALYVRVSTADQKGGMESQTLALRTFCERNNISDYEIFTDENQSGAKASRPALDRMMKAVKDGQLNKIIVFSFSRLARSTVHLLSALDEFKKYKVQLISLSEQIDTNSPIGVALFTLTGQSIPENAPRRLKFSVLLDPSYFGPTCWVNPSEVGS